MTQGKSLVEDMARARRIEQAAIRLSDAFTGGGVRATHGADHETILQRAVERQDEIIAAVTELNLALREQSKAAVLKDRLPADDRELVERLREIADGFPAHGYDYIRGYLNEAADRIIAYSASRDETA